MFCPACGQENSNNMKFCGNCGNSIEGLAAAQYVPSMGRAINPPMTFSRAISTCLSKYFEFKGRASRPEFWWFTLFTAIVSVVAGIIDHTRVLENLASLIFLFPSLAVGSRRLHDTGRSGWWQLIAFTIIGIIPLVIWVASKGSNQGNQYRKAM